MKTKLSLLFTLLPIMICVAGCGSATPTNNTANASSTRIPLTVSNSSNSTNRPANGTAHVSDRPTNPGAVDEVTPEPETKPKDATALCKDGTYSTSKNANEQCAAHGGVDKKL